MSAEVYVMVSKIRKAISTNFMEPHLNDCPFEDNSDPDIDDDESKSNIRIHNAGDGNEDKVGDDYANGPESMELYGVHHGAIVYRVVSRCCVVR